MHNHCSDTDTPKMRNFCNVLTSNHLLNWSRICIGTSNTSPHENSHCPYPLVSFVRNVLAASVDSAISPSPAVVNLAALQNCRTYHWFDL